MRMRYLCMPLGCLLVGCSSDKTAEQVAAMNTSNIQRLGNIYAAFQNYKGGRGPKDEAEFKDFIKNYDLNKLKMMGIDPDNLDAVFTSENDRKPFKLRFGVGGGRGSSDPVVFEQDGANGKRRVGFTGGKVEEVDDATYKLMLAGKAGSTGPSGPPAGTPGGKDAGRPKGGGPPPGAPTGPGK